jgi:hypothetical protein
MKLNRQLAYYKLSQIEEQLTIQQVIHARRFRNWRKFDKLSEDEKLWVRLEEFEIYADDLDPEYVPKGPKGDTDI